MLHPHEFVQASGRAGRRGIDTVGHVIHLSNLFKNVDLTEYRIMMQGKPQTLISKFKISYNLLLNLINIGDKDYLQFCKRSMIQDDIDSSLGQIYNSMAKLEGEIDTISQGLEYLRTPFIEIEKYLNMVEAVKTLVNKKRKDMDKEIQNSLNAYKFMETDKHSVIKYRGKMMELSNLRTNFKTTESFLNESVQKILKKMETDGFIKTEEGTQSLTPVGFMATHLREIHCLVFAKLLEQDRFNELDARQIVSVFSCFTNVNVNDEQKSFRPSTRDVAVKNMIEDITKSYNSYQDFETENNTFTGVDYTMHYDLIDAVLAWCDCESAPECKAVIQTLEQNKGIFLGEFVKAITKINNISTEMEKIVESIGNIELLSKLRDIPRLTLKFVATNQSLYV
jgi:hypothetical protein